MIRLRPWLTLATIAWRDLRSSRTKSALIVITIAISIGGVTGVRTTATIARETVQRDSRAWLAGDVCADTGESIGPEQSASLDRLRSSGVDWTLVTWALTMAASNQAPDPVLIAVKAVDPSVYPFYGASVLSPSQTLSSALTTNTVVVSPNVLDRLQLRVGGTMLIGGQPFRIAAVTIAEPDPYNGVFGIGMHCIISREGYRRTGLARSGNSEKNRALLKLPSGGDLGGAIKILRTIFPEANIFDYREASRNKISKTETIISFLGVTSFLTLILGAMGVAAALRLHIEQRMATFAVMKMIGARTTQIVATIFLQIAWLMAVAFVIGVPLGWAIGTSLLRIGNRYIAFPAAEVWNLNLLECAFAGIAAFLPIFVQPANDIRNLRPAAILRRGTQESALSGKSKAGLLIVLGTAFAYSVFGVVAFQLLGSWNSILLLAALAASFGLAWIFSTIALAALRRVILFPQTRWIPTVRYGITNLYRPLNSSRTIVTALALGLMMIIATFASSGAITAAVVDTMHFDRNSLFLVNFEEKQRASLQSFLESQPDVESIEFLTHARLRMTSIQGVPIETVQKNGGRDAGVSSWYVADCEGSASKPIGGPLEMTMEEDLARRLHTPIGSRFTFETRDATLPAVLARVRKPTSSEGFGFTFTLDCNALENVGLFHQASVRIKPGQIPKVRSALNARYPALGMITAGEIAESIAVVSGDALTLVRIVAWYAIGTGLSVLIAIITASRLPRLREIGILSSVGATRSTLIKIYTVEFAVIGLLSGGIGSLLAYGFTSVALTVISLHPQTAVEWKGVAAALAVSAALAIAAGWLPTYALLRRKPLEILRGE